MIKKSLKQKVKKITAVTFMCMLFSTTAFASKHSFKFELPKGGTGITASNPKNDNDIYAYVTVDSANLGSQDSVRYVVTNSDQTKEVTKPFPTSGTKKPNRSRLKYNNSSYAKKGKKYCLKITTYNYSRKFSGKWNS
ncbi:MAG: hypothetical protein K2N34_11430 [Lachnospiraceae bacterium]|nr:hypothetical protein [Lachnospiraceae bacterium]